jgi:hypothetical protein
MVRAGGRRLALAPRCPVLPFHEPMLVRRPALRRHRHFPAAKAGTTKAPLLVMKCAAGIVASPQGRGNRRSVGTPWKASVQGRTAWKPSFQFRSWRARFHPGQGTRGGTRPSKAGRRLRGREAFGVHQLAGAVEDPYCAGRPATPLPPSTNDRIGCSPDDIAQWRAGFHPGPMVTIRLEGPVHPGQGTRWNASLRVRPAPPRSRSAWRAPVCRRFPTATPRPETCRPTAMFQGRATPGPMGG